MISLFSRKDHSNQSYARKASREKRNISRPQNVGEHEGIGPVANRGNGLHADVSSKSTARGVAAKPQAKTIDEDEESAGGSADGFDEALEMGRVGIKRNADGRHDKWGPL